MGVPDLFTSDPSEDLAVFAWDLAAPEPLSGADCQAFEFSSRGDRVVGRLLRPGASEAPLPLVLLQNAAGTWRQASPLDAATRRWLEAGAAVASIDLPLHGARASAKLSERLLGALGSDPNLAPRELDPVARLLRIEFTRQAVADLRRGVDAVGQIAAIDPERLAFVGLGAGATVGAIFCALDPRPGAIALAPLSDRAAPTEVDPARHIAMIAPRPLLLLDTGASPADPGEPALEALLQFVAKHLHLP